jgi:hypothetical protein
VSQEEYEAMWPLMKASLAGQFPHEAVLRRALIVGSVKTIGLSLIGKEILDYDRRAVRLEWEHGAACEMSVPLIDSSERDSVLLTVIPADSLDILRSRLGRKIHYLDALNVYLDGKVVRTRQCIERLDHARFLPNPSAVDLGYLEPLGARWLDGLKKAMASRNLRIPRGLKTAYVVEAETMDVVLGQIYTQQHAFIQSLLYEAHELSTQVSAGMVNAVLLASRKDMLVVTPALDGRYLVVTLWYALDPASDMLDTTHRIADMLKDAMVPLRTQCTSSMAAVS